MKVSALFIRAPLQRFFFSRTPVGSVWERSLLLSSAALKLRMMEADDPKRAYFLKELSELMQVRRLLKSASDQVD
jgi:hypothetical protein